jgi:hypothetical protein
MANAISLFHRILVEHAAFVVLPPVLWVHGVIAYQFQLTETVVAVVTASGRVDNKFLACLGICELLRAFVWGETVVLSAAVGSLLPGILGYTVRRGKHKADVKHSVQAHLMICLWVRFDETVHGSSILVMQRLAGHDE